MKYFELTFTNQSNKIQMPEDGEFYPYRDYPIPGKLIAVREMEPEEFNQSELSELRIEDLNVT